MVRPGFKQTEAGEIPENWNTEPLRSCLKCNPKYGINAPAVPLEGKLPAYLRITDISDDGRFKPNPLVGVNHNESSNYYLKKDDLVFARTGASVGKCYKYCEEDGELVYAGFLIKITPDDSKLLSEYLFQYVNTNRYWQWIKLMSMRSGQPGVNGNEYGLLPLPLPKTSEQKVIAKALSDVDELIVSLEKLIAKKRDIKTATMQQLLTGKTRLPGFGKGKGTKLTELGEIPEDWDILTFEELRDLNDGWSITGGPFGSNLKSSDYTESGVRIIQLQNIGDGEFVNDYVVYTSVDKANELRSCNIYPEEIILSKMGDPVARACIIPNFHERYLMCSDGIRLKVDSKRHNSYFIFLVINSRKFRSQAISASTGSTRQRIGLTELKELKLICPQKNEQESIAKIFIDMDAELNLLVSKLEKTKSIKHGMMQELLTGRTRIINEELKMENG